MSDLKAEVLITGLLRQKLYAKEVNVGRLEAVLVTPDILRCEVQNVMDHLSCITHKMKDLQIQVRFLARSFGVPGNHLGQQSHGFRWPYGPVAVITPFNFPLEIPLLQLMGALYMGNKPILKVDSKVGSKTYKLDKWTYV